MSVSYVESPIYRLVKEIREKGYETADCGGLSRRVFEARDTKLGLLKLRPSKEGFLGRSKRQRNIFFCTIWLDNSSIGAHIDKKWVLEVYGRTYLEEAKKLAEDLASKFKVHIEIQLATETEKEEMYLSDIDF